MAKLMCFCGERFTTQDDADAHKKKFEHLACREEAMPHFIFTYTKRSRFINWFWSIDITFHIALWAGVTVNCMVMYHAQWGFACTLGESLCMGFVLSRLFQK